MGDIFKYLSQRENILVIQFLNRRLYLIKVPTFVQQVLLVMLKIAAKHEYVHMVRTMNSESHQYQQINYVLNGVAGKL